MTFKTMQSPFSNRQFLSMVRAELALLGRTDVAVERSWIVEGDTLSPFLLNVPVGNELAVLLKARTGLFDEPADDRRASQARDFALALVNLKSAEGMLDDYARAVRRAADEAVGEVRATGLDIQLDSVGFKPTDASYLTSDSWKEAALHILACVRLRRTSFYLQPEIFEIWVEEATDVAYEIASISDEQAERQERLAELEALGADLVTDNLTIDLLAAHGLDAADLLRQIWRKQSVGAIVEHRGKDTCITLVSENGRVTASMELDGAFWNGAHLWFLSEERYKHHGDLVGRSLGSLVSHPAFTSRPILAVERRHIDHISFDLTDEVLFDADTGRIWRRQERQAA